MWFLRFSLIGGFNFNIIQWKNVLVLVHNMLLEFFFLCCKLFNMLLYYHREEYNHFPEHFSNWNKSFYISKMLNVDAWRSTRAQEQRMRSADSSTHKHMSQNTCDERQGTVFVSLNHTEYSPCLLEPCLLWSLIITETNSRI